MSAAGKISRLAVGDASIRPVIQNYTIPVGLVQNDRMSEDLSVRVARWYRDSPLLPG